MNATENELLTDSMYIDRLIHFVNHAKYHILICSFTWRWYEQRPALPIQQFNIAITKARVRGVDVKVILNDNHQAQKLAKLGFNVKTIRDKGRTHTKAFLVDDEVLLVGSHNLTHAGTSNNYETSVCTYDVESCLQFARYFQGLWEFITVGV